MSAFAITQAMRAAWAAMPNRCIECLRSLPSGNRCKACEAKWRFGVPLVGWHIAGNHHPETPHSEIQYHGDNYPS